MQLYHFDQMIKEASKAIYLGLPSMGDKWIGNIVNRGEQWDIFLLNLLSDQTADFKSDYYEKIFLNSNKENAELLMRIAYRLSGFYFKLSVKKQEDDKDVKDSYRLVQKAA